MADRKPIPKKLQQDYISDDETSDEELDPHLRTTPKERHYGTVSGSAQVTQAALSHSRVQANPTVECGLYRHPDTQQSPQQAKETNVTDKKTYKQAK